jgi:hypothetical protein
MSLPWDADRLTAQTRNGLYRFIINDVSYYYYRKIKSKSVGINTFLLENSIVVVRGFQFEYFSF